MIINNIRHNSECNHDDKKLFKKLEKLRDKYDKLYMKDMGKYLDKNYPLGTQVTLELNLTCSITQ